MTDAHAAAKRVTAFLDRRAAFKGVEPEFLLALDGNRYVLRVSDLRALVAALPAERNTKPFTWYIDGVGDQRHAPPCSGAIMNDGTDDYLRCSLCGEDNR